MDQPSSMWGIVSHSVVGASPLEQGVLLLLVILSIVSWAIIFAKSAALKRCRRNGEAFVQAVLGAAHSGEALERGKAAGPSPQLAVFTAAVHALEEARNEPEPPAAAGHIPLRTRKNLGERLRIRMEAASREQFSKLSRGMDVLATCGSASPFIGLFGTVWGIMATFQVLGTAKSASLQVVAPGISAALIATAAGLAVAIPAVAAYNRLSARLDEEQERSDGFMERVVFLIGAADEQALAAQPARSPVATTTTTATPAAV